nr:MAG TPA: hypothetical protein [Caudoviricetes sp.]
MTWNCQGIYYNSLRVFCKLWNCSNYLIKFTISSN